MADESESGATVSQRLAELYRRLHQLARPETAEGTHEQLCTVLDEVEDELSGVPKKSPPPPPTSADGRMYCPHDDFIERKSDSSILAYTRGHRIEITDDGKLRIINRGTQEVEFEDE